MAVLREPQTDDRTMASRWCAATSGKRTKTHPNPDSRTFHLFPWYDPAEASGSDAPTPDTSIPPPITLDFSIHSRVIAHFVRWAPFFRRCSSNSKAALFFGFFDESGVNDFGMTRTDGALHADAVTNARELTSLIQPAFASLTARCPSVCRRQTANIMHVRASERAPSSARTPAATAVNNALAGDCVGSVQRCGGSLIVLSRTQ